MCWFITKNSPACTISKLSAPNPVKNGRKGWGKEKRDRNECSRNEEIARGSGGREETVREEFEPLAAKYWQSPHPVSVPKICSRIWREMECRSVSLLSLSLYILWLCHKIALKFFVAAATCLQARGLITRRKTNKSKEAKTNALYQISRRWISCTVSYLLSHRLALARLIANSRNSSLDKRKQSHHFKHWTTYMSGHKNALLMHACQYHSSMCRCQDKSFLLSHLSHYNEIGRMRWEPLNVNL